MAARSGQKVKLLRIIDILREFSDEDNPITATEICEKLDTMGVTAERKAIYNDIDVLIDYGCDIVKATSPKKGFFLASREFELPEIYLLGDAVRAADFISARKTRELISKLDRMLSREQIKRREKGIYIDEASKCANEEIYYTIDSISRAIELKRKVTFKYCVRKLSADRSMITDVKEMKISPYALTWQSDHYYMIGNYEKYDNLIHLRVDRMRSVEITDEPFRHFSEVSSYTDRFDIADYTRRLFSMYGGELEEVEFSCSKKILEQIIDRFSDRIFIKNVTDDRFSFCTKAAISEALVTFVINYAEDIEVISPPLLREMVLERAKRVTQIYETNSF